MKIESGLILEGGGMRGVYTAGILELFLENGLEMPYIIGVSAGACHAASYISKQKGRNKKVSVSMIDDPRYIRYKGIIDGTGLFNMDFIFNQIPNELVKFDYDAFRAADQKLIAVVTDCATGQPIYMDCDATDTNEDLMNIIMASSSLPLIAPVVHYKGYALLDGGISDSIPIFKAKAEGHSKNVVVLTRPRGYLKKPKKYSGVYKLLLNKEWEGMTQAIMNRHIHYNRAIDEINRLEANGDVFVFAPSSEVVVKRAERDEVKLEAMYQRGYDDAKNRFDELLSFLKVTQ